MKNIVHLQDWFAILSSIAVICAALVQVILKRKARDSAKEASREH